MVTSLNSPSLVIALARYLEDRYGARIDGPSQENKRRARDIINFILEFEDGDAT